MVPTVEFKFPQFSKNEKERDLNMIDTTIMQGIYSSGLELKERIQCYLKLINDSW